MGIGSAASEVFHLWCIESLASTQGPSKVATQIKNVREYRKFCSKLQWMFKIKTVLGDSVI